LGTVKKFGVCVLCASAVENPAPQSRQERKVSFKRWNKIERVIYLKIALRNS